MVTEIARTIGWIAGCAVAAVMVVALREFVRASLALVFGFRVFELRLGAGAPLVVLTLGPLDIALAPLPLAGAAIARSGDPQRHRLARGLMAIAPLVPQLCWLGLRALGGDGARADGFDAWACVDIANGALLTMHLVWATEFRGGVRTDIRLALDATLGRAALDRSARANYYARLTRHHLERADVDSARKALAQGLRQLGPESLLVRCRDRMDGDELSSVIDQGECADALRLFVEEAEPTRREERKGWSLSERIGQAAISVLPIAIALGGLGVVQAERIAGGLESGLIHASDRAAAGDDASRCSQLKDAYRGWTRIDPRDLIPSDAARDRHHRLARLEACLGRFDSAAAHLGEALLAANASRIELESALPRTAHAWLENEIQSIEILREIAADEATRHGRRKALLTLRRIETQLRGVATRLRIFADDDDQTAARETLERVRVRLEALREEILAG